LIVVAVFGKDCEIIFDPIAKSAIVRDEETLLWLDGPFRTYAEAVNYAVVHLEKRAAQGVPLAKIDQHQPNIVPLQPLHIARQE